MKIFVCALFLIFQSVSFAAGEEDLKTLFVELGKKVNPAVVNIFTTQSMKNPYGYGGGGFRGMPMDPFQQFMEEFMGRGLMQQQPERKASSLGSGFIIEDSGLIVTNFHVIQNASDIQVQLTEKSKKTYKAKVVGSDERTDIALIKIDLKQKLPTVALGDSDKVEVGQWVAAFGNPFGHGHTMTKGIISAKERDVETENSPTFPFLQTDASINPGNSGGPLVNTKGEVIGVNAAIDGRAQGIGFAIPINVVKKLIPDLKTKGRVTRSYLGVTINNINEKMVEEFGLKTDKGALVLGVAQGSPADKAGIEPYDVIVAINGREVEDAREITNKITETKSGETINLKIIREAKPIDVKVRVVERNDAALAQSPQKIAPKGVAAPYGIGLEILDLNAVLNQQLGLPPQIKGVIITSIKPGSVADEAGLSAGDIILDVNKKPVRSAREALKLFKKSRNSLRISRSGMEMFFFMDSK
ncbi:MAG: Do family serine endopeptidase [Oligoflexia bacterium]|nr:Do family serine endopeptidase [Oligoflexia bacterium]